MSEVERIILADLTAPQREAVTHIDGPLLVLAGAGSGKTRTITRRVAWLIANGVSPRSILAVTFTNKAANEMKERVEALMTPLDPDGWGGRPTVATFHSFAARILREFHEKVGLGADYSIYDQSDRTRAIKLATERIGLDPSNFPPADLESVISGQKNQLVEASEYAKTAGQGLFRDRKLADIWTEYEKVLAEADAVDFDDLLLRLAKLLRDDAAFRSAMNERYRYVLIDEYQDTNRAQYQIAHELTREHRNLCATGDPDQSIYGWRGADIDNIMRFERDYPGTKVVRLEQNYRSTKRILAAADALIKNNVKRKHKGLWTENAEGDRIEVVRVTDAEAEAELLADRIAAAQAGGLAFGQMAVFMRLNALTRVLEQSLRRRSIPYQIARGVSFYNRKEIKDAIAYLRLLVNPDDRIALERIVNTPPRGIGKTTVDRLAEYAGAAGISLWDAAARVGSDAPALTASGGDPATVDTALIERLGRGAAAVRRFVTLVESMGAEHETCTGVQQIVEGVLSDSGLAAMCKDDEQASANLAELITAAGEYDRDSGFEATLGDWLRDVALVSDVDAIDPEVGAVTLMTLHAAKGLEFPLVFIVGCEEGIIPHRRDDSVRDIEEERRLFFVGITRAMRRLVLTHAAIRMLHGKTDPREPSAFLSELPAAVLDVKDQSEPVHDTFQPGWSRQWNGGGSRGGWQKRPAEETASDDFAELKRGSALYTGGGRGMSRADLEGIGRAEQESSQASNWPIGTLVRHAKFGVGKVMKVTPSGPYTKATIDFKRGGIKAVIMEMAPVERVEG
ncbi:MAG: ATP-dependent DNA helicase PcrA [Phycisphaerae bacterium]|nr:ATP-dependent DNA helicase PcrA [Phycisphaerae bacterium]